MTTVPDQPPGWRMALRIALREARGGPGALRLLFACVLLGVLAIAAVGSLGSAIATGMANEGQTILGADIEVRLSQRKPTPQEHQAFKQAGLVSEGARMRAMLRGETGAASGRELLVELKAVDTGWPLYGQAQLGGGGGNTEVQEALAKGAVVAEPLAAQLGLRPGDMVSIGMARMPVAAILTVEPDRAGEGFTLGPSVLVSMQALDQTGLIQPGSLYTWHVRLKLPPGADPAGTADALNAAFPHAGWRMIDRRDAAPGVGRFMDRMTGFLTLVGLASLAVAGVGVGNGVRTYLDRRSATIATLKALGACSALIRRAYLLVIAAVALVAAFVGALLGAAAPMVVVGLAGDALPVPPAVGLYPAPLLTAMTFGLLLCLAFALPPLARASALPAQGMFRGSAESWPWPSARTLAVSFIAGALAVALGVWQAPDRQFALMFLGGAAAVLVVLHFMGALAERAARRLPRPRSAVGLLALSSTRRPGAMTRQLVVALGLGLSLFSALAFIESGFSGELNRTVPEKAPAFFLLDLPKDDHDRFLALMPKGTDLRLVPSLRGPVVAVKGVPVSELGPPPEGSYVLEGDRGLTFSADIPQGNTLTEGKWWPAGYAGPPLVSMEAEQARLLGLRVGDTITVSVLGTDITATIASLRQVDWDSLGFNFVLVYDPATLAGAPYSFMATATPPDASLAGFTNLVSRNFPSISVIRVADVVGQVSGILRQTGVAVRAAASVAILAGIAVLAGAMAAQARVRTADNVIMKTLGATRLQLMSAAAIEYAGLGFIVGIASLLLGGVAGWLVLRQVLNLGWHPDWPMAILTVLAGALLTMFLGLAGAWRTLGTRVATALRQQ